LLAASLLAPYSNNARTHSPEQVRQIKQSMLEFGWTNPILADFAECHTVVAGHGRLMAALELYKEGHVIKTPSGADIPANHVPAIDCTGWSEPQRRAYVLADNKLALNAGWDVEMLKHELLELRDLDFDLGLTGFLPTEIDDLLTRRLAMRIATRTICRVWWSTSCPRSATSGSAAITASCAAMRPTSSTSSGCSTARRSRPTWSGPTRPT
jgi:ParB-like chromosome segregation protein Spo0J